MTRSRTVSSASILHADLDAFYASVEQRDDPRLRGRPVIVGGGVVLAASYEAKAHGVRTAMGGLAARRLCPTAVVVPPRFEAYLAASKAVFAIFDDVTPWVEGISIDEAFLDVAGAYRLSGSPAHIATGLRARVAAEVGLVITVGVARTKFLAKVASRVAKPDGLLLIAPEKELEFLHPLPVVALWGVGEITADALATRGVHTVGDVATLPVDVLCAMVGKAAGRQLFALSRNHDPRPVQVGVRRRSIGSQTALGRRRRSAAEIDALLIGIVDRVTRRMRAADRVGRTVVLRLRFDDFGRATRSHTLEMPTAGNAEVLATARALLAAAGPLIQARGLTLIGLSVADVSSPDAVQLVLPLDRAERGGTVDAAIDEVRRRFGSKALTPAVLMGSQLGFEAPMLPD
ncbi:MAG TPA: DNA polymerase IV [Sporichthyaceae bacterium]|nr:DNA polymerase IV [Sporichthyaceae bacterium]